MTEQIFDNSQKDAQKVFSKIGLGLLMFTLIANAFAALLIWVLKNIIPSAELANYGMIISVVISALSMYAVALPIISAFWRPLEKSAPGKNRVSFGNFMLFFVVSIACAYIGRIISIMIQTLLYSTLGVTFMQDTVAVVGQMKWYEAFLPVVFVLPFFEELLFRKMIIDRTRRYGEKLSVLFAALMFAFFHTSINQFFYTFAIGLLLGYLYMRSGNIITCWLIHAAFNFIGSILPLCLEEYGRYEEILKLAEITDPEEMYAATMELYLPLVLTAMYGLVMISLTVVGVVLACIMRKRVFFERAEMELPKDCEGAVAFANAGVAAFIVCSVLLIVFTGVS